MQSNKLGYFEDNVFVRQVEVVFVFNDKVLLILVIEDFKTGFLWSLVD